MTHPSESNSPITFLDIESDGIHPGRKPWEIAMVRREPDGTEKECSFFVDIDLSTADPFGLRVGRFWERHPLGRAISSGATFGVKVFGSPKTTLTAAQLVARFTHGAHIVGAVPNFDTETLDPLLRAHGLLPGWHYHLIDIESLAVGFLAAKGRPIAPPWKSDEVFEALGLEPTPKELRHTAMGDVRDVIRVYDAINGAAWAVPPFATDGGDRK